LIVGVSDGAIWVGVDVRLGRRVAVRVGRGVGMDDGEETGVNDADVTADEVEVEKAIAVGATVTEGIGSRGVLHAANIPSNKNKSRRIWNTTHLAMEQRTSAIVR
jgi:hypothetical protein